MSRGPSFLRFFCAAIDCAHLVLAVHDASRLVCDSPQQCLRHVAFLFVFAATCDLSSSSISREVAEGFQHEPVEADTMLHCGKSSDVQRTGVSISTFPFISVNLIAPCVSRGDSCIILTFLKSEA
ncbi:hypothetical protein BC834DRAFT_554869 [Gloeopeniophorella convolvens]|nr:hypothetical protein BC834DRAFT_554869 [Gloeopeniophorella convolvens]